MEKIPLIVVAGPTASGKTRLAVEIAKRYGGEVVSADSMQIYKYMNIGTAKPTEQEMDGVAHHMLDIVYPDELFPSPSTQNWRAKRLPMSMRGAGFLFWQAARGCIVTM